MALKRRIEKLEKRVGIGKVNTPIIGYCCHQKDGRGSAGAAQKKSVEEWEAKNGPLGDREPFFIERWIVVTSPKGGEISPKPA
jgi:hypothetical protein